MFMLIGSHMRMLEAFASDFKVRLSRLQTVQYRGLNNYLYYFGGFLTIVIV